MLIEEHSLSTEGTLMKIIYIGIDLMVSALHSLLAEKAKIACIYTCSTDNKTEFNTEIIRTAVQYSIPYTIGRIHREELLRFCEQGVDTVICAGYYYKIPVVSGLRMINIHPTLLPEGRGAWPMPLLILSQHRQGGVTIHQLTEEMDAGPILMQKAFDMSERETLSGYMSQVNHAITQMIPQLVQSFDQLYEKASPQVGGSYLPTPTEADWTVHAWDSDETADRILRAFYGYECIYEDALGKAELIGGRLLDKNESPSENETIIGMTCSGSRIAAAEYRTISVNACSRIETCMKDSVDRLNEMMNINSAASAFCSLYIWAPELSLSIILDEHFYAVKCGLYGSNTWFVPCGEKYACMNFLYRKMADPDFRMTYVSDQQKEMIAQWFPGQFEFTENPAQNEYVSEIAGHMSLEGHAYKNVRNHWRKAIREHEFRIEKGNPGNIAEINAILEQWTQTYSEEHGKIGAQKKAYRSAEDLLINHMDVLNAEIYLIYADGKPYSVTGGYPLRDEIFDLAIAKECKRLSGSGYAPKHLVMEQLRDRYRYVNLEEDLGNEGLKRMKNAFVPAYIIRMYDVRRKK